MSGVSATKRRLRKIRGLEKFISDIRDCKNQLEERKIIDDTLTKISNAFVRNTHNSLPTYDLKKYVWVLLYISFLGYKVNIGINECLQLLSSSNSSVKHCGYIGISLLYASEDRNAKFDLLFIDSLITDLQSKNEIHRCYSLACIANVSHLNNQSLIANIETLLLQNIEMLIEFDQTFVIKKACLCLTRILKFNPKYILSSIHLATYSKLQSYQTSILILLKHSNLGVVLCALNLLNGLLSNQEMKKMKVNLIVNGFIHEMKNEEFFIPSDIIHLCEKYFDADQQREFSVVIPQIIHILVLCTFDFNEKDNNSKEVTIDIENESETNEEKANETKEEKSIEKEEEESNEEYDKKMMKMYTYYGVKAAFLVPKLLRILQYFDMKIIIDSVDEYSSSVSASPLVSLENLLKMLNIIIPPNINSSCNSSHTHICIAMEGLAFIALRMNYMNMFDTLFKFGFKTCFKCAIKALSPFTVILNYFYVSVKSLNHFAKNIQYMSVDHSLCFMAEMENLLANYILNIHKHGVLSVGHCILELCLEIGDNLSNSQTNNKRYVLCIFEFIFRYLSDIKEHSPKAIKSVENVKRILLKVNDILCNITLHHSSFVIRSIFDDEDDRNNEEKEELFWNSFSSKLKEVKTQEDEENKDDKYPFLSFAYDSSIADTLIFNDCRNKNILLREYFPQMKKWLYINIILRMLCLPSPLPMIVKEIINESFFKTIGNSKMQTHLYCVQYAYCLMFKLTKAKESMLNSYFIDVCQKIFQSYQYLLLENYGISVTQIHSVVNKAQNILVKKSSKEQSSVEEKLQIKTESNQNALQKNMQLQIYLDEKINEDDTIIIETLKGRKYILHNINVGIHTILDLQNAIFEHDGIPVLQQILVHNNITLPVTIFLEEKEAEDEVKKLEEDDSNNTVASKEPYEELCKRLTNNVKTLSEYDVKNGDMLQLAIDYYPAKDPKEQKTSIEYYSNVYVRAAMDLLEKIGHWLALGCCLCCILVFGCAVDISALAIGYDPDFFDYNCIGIDAESVSFFSADIFLQIAGFCGLFGEIIVNVLLLVFNADTAYSYGGRHLDAILKFNTCVQAFIIGYYLFTLAWIVIGIIIAAQMYDSHHYCGNAVPAMLLSWSIIKFVYHLCKFGIVFAADKYLD